MDADLSLAWLGRYRWLVYDVPRSDGGRGGGEKKKHPESHLAKSNQMKPSVWSPNAADIEASAQG